MSSFLIQLFLLHWLAFLFCCRFGSSSSSCSSKEFLYKTPLPMKVKNLTIVATSDIHGRLNHLPSLASLTKSLRREGPLLIVDSGDVAFGSSFTRRYGPAAVYQALDVGFHAIALGNHDLDVPLESFKKDFPIISVNAEKRGVIPSSINNISGVIVGLMGYTMTSNFSQSIVLKQILEEVKELHYQKPIDLVILLGHGGIEIDTYIAENSRGVIDIILGGHSHVKSSCDGKFHNGDVVIHSGYHGETAAVVKVTTSTLGKTIRSNIVQLNASAHPVNTSALKPLPGSTSASRLGNNNHNGSSKAAIAINLGLDISENVVSCRSEKCYTGHLITSAIRVYYNCTPLVVFESGSIRDNFKAIITEENLEEIIPWENKMMLLRVPGKDLRNMFQQSNRVKNSGGYLQSSATGTPAFGHQDDGSYMGTPAQPSAVVGGKKMGKLNANSPSAAVRSHGCDMCNHAVAATPSTGTSRSTDHAAGAAMSKKHHQFFQPDVNYTIAVTDWLYGGGDNYGQYLTNAVLLGTSEWSVRKIVTMFLLKHGHHEGCFKASMKALHPTTASSPLLLAHANHTSAAAAASNGLSPPSHSHSTEWLLRGFFAMIADGLGLMLSYPALVSAVRLQAVVPVRERDHLPTTASTAVVEANHGFIFFVFVRLLSSLLYWSIYEYAISMLADTYHIVDPFNKGMVGFAASTLAGAFVALVTNPLWVIITRIQVYGSASEFHYGMLCDGVFMNLLLVSYPSVRQLIYEVLLAYSGGSQLATPSSSASGMHDAYDAVFHGGIGFIATVFAVLVTYPLQTLRTRMQVRTNKTAAHKTSSGSSLLQRDLCNGLREKLLSSAICEFTFFFARRVLENLFLPSPPPT